MKNIIQYKIIATSNPAVYAAASSSADASKTLALNEQLTLWTREVQHLLEYENRVEAKNRILVAFLENNNSLNLSELNLTSLPECVSCLASLTTLDLSDNQLTTIPDSLSKLSALTHLNLSGNQLTAVPRFFGNFPDLTLLDLSDNRLTSIPELLDKLSALTQLNLENNYLNHIPEWVFNISSLSSESLFELQLENWVLETPDSDEFSTRIVAKKRILTAELTLDLSNLNLTSIPECISKLSALRDLNLYNNQLTYIPDSLANLSTLTTLDLSNNQLTAIPALLGNLSELMFLNLSRNQLTAIPDSLGNLPALIYLELRHNQLTAIPDSLGNLSELTFLNLSHNRLTTIPNSFQNFRNLELPLDVSNNLFLEEEVIRLQQFPFQISGLSIYDPLNQGRSLNNLSFEQLLSGLHQQAIALNIRTDTQAPWTKLLTHNSSLGSFPEFLRKLPMMSDWQETDTRKNLLITISSILDKMTEINSFREIIEIEAADAVDTCGDRVAIGLIRMSLQLQLAELSQKDTLNKTELITIAKKMSKFDAILTIARNKIPYLGNVDEIEVYLKYIKDLNEPLQLGLPITSMLYERCSGLTPAHIATAKETIETQAFDNMLAWIADNAELANKVPDIKQAFDDIQNLPEFDTDAILDGETDNDFIGRLNAMPNAIKQKRIMFLRRHLNPILAT